MAKQYETGVAYKYVIYKTKKFVGGGCDKTKYMGSFDSCIFEIFGVSHFTRKMSEAYDNRDIMSAIDRVGLKYLIDIFNNNRLSNIFKEMIDIDYRMRELKKEIRKQSKKGKRDKYSVKEYQYLQNLYKKAGKYLRNKLGIKNARTAYKRRYRAINDVVGSRYYDDDFSSIFMRDDYDIMDDPYDIDGDPYEDDGYDYDESSDLEDFERMLHGRSTKPRGDRKRYDFDEDEEEYVDEYDDIDDEDIDPYSKPKRSRRKQNDYELDSEYDDRLDKLTDIVVNLSADVQALVNKDEYVQRNFRPKQTVNLADMYPSFIHPLQEKRDEKTEMNIIIDFMSKLGDEINQIKGNSDLMKKALSQVIENQKDINDTFDAIFEDDEESEEVIQGQSSNEPDVYYNPPVVEDNPLVQMMKNIEDPYEDDEALTKEKSVVNPDRMTREELIEKINSSEEVQIESTEKTESK